jgi:hypothetical protein
VFDIVQRNVNSVLYFLLEIALGEGKLSTKYNVQSTRKKKFR